MLLVFNWEPNEACLIWCLQSYFICLIFSNKSRQNSKCKMCPLQWVMSHCCTLQASNEWRLKAPDYSELTKSHITKKEKKNYFKRFPPALKIRRPPAATMFVLVKAALSQGLFLFLKSDYNVYNHEAQYCKTGYLWLYKRSRGAL